ncbi:hypothetical protein MD484_g7354, partial [Candolleomyces efflorescens]
MKGASLQTIALYFVLLFATVARARTLDEPYSRRQATDVCVPACADRNAMQEACAAERDSDCCRPTYGSAHLTCAYCLSFQPGITDEERERLHRNMSAACEREGKPLQPASVTLTVTPTVAATGTSTKTTQSGPPSTSGSSSADNNSTSNGARAVDFQLLWNWLVPIICALGLV